MLRRYLIIHVSLTGRRFRLHLLLLISLLSMTASAQNRIVDSLNALLKIEKRDSNKVTLLWNLANAYNAFKPDKALSISQDALILAQHIRFTEGESRALGSIANAFNQIGNYPKALEFYLRKLQLEEKRNNPQNMASVILNIGSVYLYQEEYDKTLDYYFRADSIMKTDPPGDPQYGMILKYSIALDIGDLYNRINKPDSAYRYFQLALSLARQQRNEDFSGSSMVGLGEVYLKQKKYVEARSNLLGALPYLKASSDEDLVCETYWGLANLYDSLNRIDSAKYYAQQMLGLAQKDGYPRWELKAAFYLDAYYRKKNNADSAYTYLQMTQQLRDSMNSSERIRESQIISSNEETRQRDLAEQKRKAQQERFQQLQLLFIGIFIPALFLFTLLISRRKVHLGVIKFLGIISLLVLFEYLTLLLHPYVAEVTNHTPVVELLIFVFMATFLIRTHHRIEHWFIEKLINRRNQQEGGKIPIKRIRIKMKKPPTAE